MDIGELLAFSVKNGASDLHLSAGLPPMIRVDGDVRRINVPSMDHKDVHDMVYDIINNKKRKDYEEYLECDFSFKVRQLARVHLNTLGFNEALRSALREDPDVILVGEMRDLETIRLALTAAETGHLVFGTLHTSSAAKTIDRVVDVFPAAEKDMIRAMLSESLRAVISQTLLKKKGGGRVAAHEIMIGTQAIRTLIRENKVAQMYSSIQTGQAFGMQTLDQNLHDLVNKGVIDRDQARTKAANKDSF